MSSDILTSNLGYTKVQDTERDSKVVAGLADLGVIPFTMQSFVSTIDLTGLAVGAAVIQALVDDRTGEQIVLSEGQQVVLIRGGATSAITTEANLDLFQVGLAATATGAVAEELSNAATGEILGAATGTGLTLATNANGGVVGATNKYVVVSTTVTVADLTGGEVRVFLVVI